MRSSLIFLVVVVSVACALGAQSNVTTSTISSKDTEAPKAVPHVDDKSMTSKPEVNPAAPNTTTPPVTTTASPPTPAPIPVPAPKIAKWVYNGTDGKIIVLRMAAQFDITYNVTSEQNAKKEINIPADNSTTVFGTSDNNTETIKISWKAGNASSASGNNTVNFSFNKNDKSRTYILSSIITEIDSSELPGQNETWVLNHLAQHFNTSLGNSYRCVKLQNFNLTNGANQTVGQLKVTDFQFQAFKEDKQSNFGLAEDCAMDTSDVVPIAVGLVLAGLVVVVLVAYLISRRRSQARGYLSM